MPRRSTSCQGEAQRFHRSDDTALLLNELEELRESTKYALRVSWAEVEQLQEENTMQQELEQELRAELVASREREDILKRQMEEMKSRLDIPLECMNMNRGFTSAISDSRDTSLGGETRKKSEVSRWGAVWKISSLYDNERELMEREMIIQMTELEREKNKMIAEWQFKLERLVSSLKSMENVKKSQGDKLAELQENLETQSKQYRQKETRQRREIDFLKEKLNEKRTLIAKQNDQIRDYQTDIQGLEAELQRVKPIV